MASQFSSLAPGVHLPKVAAGHSGEHGLFVVTGIVADFVPTGVATLNPFGSRASWKWVDSALAVRGTRGDAVSVCD